MTPISMIDVAQHFSRYIDLVVERGERFTLPRDGKPVAELGPVLTTVRLEDLSTFLASLPCLTPAEGEALVREHTGEQRPTLVNGGSVSRAFRNTSASAVRFEMKSPTSTSTRRSPAPTRVAVGTQDGDDSVDAQVVAFRREQPAVSSPAMLLEVSRGDISWAQRWRLSHLDLLDIDRIQDIADIYIAPKVMPDDPRGDAVHLAVASYYRCDFLVTWNYRIWRMPTNLIPSGA